MAAVCELWGTCVVGHVGEQVGGHVGEYVGVYVSGCVFTLSVCTAVDG